MLLTGIEKIENGRIFTKDEGLFECPHCKSTFAKNFAKDKMRRWGKDKQFFYNTKHCPNCDRRILMKDENKDALQHKIERLRQYANQCRITGDLEEYREALKEIANLEAEFKSLTDNLPIKDAESIALNQIEDLKKSIAKDTALKALDSLRKDMKRTKDAGKVEVKRQSDVGSNRWGIYVNGKLVEGGFFSKEVAEETASKNYGGAKDSKDAAAVALKGLGEVRKQMKDRKTKDDVLISHYKGYMITTNGNKFQATNTVRQIDAFSKEELYRKVDDIEEKRAKMREINRRNADSKTKDSYNYKGKDYSKNELWNELVKEGNIKRFGELTEEEKKIKGDRFAIYESRSGRLYAVVRDSQIKDADLPIGKHNADPDDQFNAEELAMGIKIEMEHTTNPDIAKEIAKDHLSEIPDYYTRLTKMEEEAKKEKES